MESPQPCLLICEIQISNKKPRPHEAHITLPTRYALLNICPERQGEIARPVTWVYKAGKKSWREFDTMRVFESEVEALAYAQKEGIEIYLTCQVQGKAQNAKSGAILLTEVGESYYLAGKHAWSEQELNQTLTIKGTLRTVLHDTDALKTPQGAYQAGMAGKQSILEDWAIL